MSYDHLTDTVSACTHKHPHICTIEINRMNSLNLRRTLPKKRKERLQEQEEQVTSNDRHAVTLVSIHAWNTPFLFLRF